jgi:hypothetical protein
MVASGSIPAVSKSEYGKMMEGYLSMKTEKCLCIKVWKYKDAPKKYRELSLDSNNDDWLAFIPEEIKNLWYPFDWIKDYKVDGGVVRIALREANKEALQ